MRRSPHQPATYADLEALPDTVVGEILDGELFITPRPPPPQTVVASALGALLNVLYQQGLGGPGGWWVHDEPELHLGPKGAQIVVPDICGWRRARMPEQPKTAYYTVVPDWLCEVLSPSTARLDRMKKLALYEAVGVAHVWLVDPLLETIEVFTHTSEGWRYQNVSASEAAAHIAPFAEVPLDLPRIWDGVRGG